MDDIICELRSTTFRNEFFFASKDKQLRFLAMMFEALANIVTADDYEDT